MLALGRDGGSEKLRDIFDEQFRNSSADTCMRGSYGKTDIILEIKDADQAHLGVEEGITDLAFTVVCVLSLLLCISVLFAEPMVFLCAEDSRYMNSWNERNAEKVEKDQLDLTMKYMWTGRMNLSTGIISCFRGGSRSWHYSIMNQLQFFLRKRDSWAFVPASVAVGLWQKAG